MRDKEKDSKTGKGQKPFSLPENYVQKLEQQLEKWKPELERFGLIEDDRIVLSRVIRVLADRGLPDFLRDLELVRKSRMEKSSSPRQP
jgi:hypothetical protein